MATMSEMNSRLRALWEASERVAAARLMNPTTLSTALTVRNDIAGSIEMAFSALHKENARLKKLVAKLDQEAGND